MRRWALFVLLLLMSTACQTEATATVGFLQGNFAYIADEDRVQVLDISDEAAPKLVTEISITGMVMKVVADGRFLYIAHRPTVWNTVDGLPNTGLQIIDISDPRQPQLRGFYRTRNLPTDLAVQGDIAYLADWEAISVVDVSDKDAPFGLTELAGSTNSLFIDDGKLAASWGGCDFRSGFCDGGFNIYDLADPKRPSLLGQHQADGLPGYDIALANNIAFLTGKGLWATDLTDLQHLAVDGRYEHNDGWLFAAKIWVADNIVYAAQQDGLYLLDIRQATAPKLLAHYASSNQTTDLVLRDGRLYLVGWSGLEIVDVRDPTNPQLLGFYATQFPVPTFPQPTATP